MGQTTFSNIKKALTLLQVLDWIKLFLVGDTWIEHVTSTVWRLQQFGIFPLIINNLVIIKSHKVVYL